MSNYYIALIIFLIIVVIATAFIWVFFIKKEKKSDFVSIDTTNIDDEDEDVFNSQDATGTKEKEEFSYEKKIEDAIEEDKEYFQACRNKTNDKFLECHCESVDVEEKDYAGKPYSSYIKDVDLTGDITKHHQKWLNDREQLTKKGGAYFTGRTYSPDSHDSYDPIPWIGLKRPMAVPFCNPKEVPDVNFDLYRTKKYCI